MSIASSFRSLAELSAKKAPYDDALALAQRRAALPVSQGGLGLPAGNTPMERADVMFPASLYHATDKEFNAFDLSRAGSGTTMTPTEKAVFMTNNPSAADEFIAGPYYKSGDDVARYYADGAQVMPLRASLKPEVWEMGGGMYRAPFVEGAIKEAKDAGADSVVFKNMRDPGFSTSGRPPLSHVVAGLEPKNIRSRFAAFDPFRRNESDLLAGIAPWFTGLGAAGLTGAAMAPGEAEAGIGSKLYHATTKGAGREIKRWNEVEPRIGKLVESTEAYKSTDNPLDVSFFSDNLKDAAGWLRFFTSQKTGKPLNEVTAADIAEHGALAVARKGPQHYRNLGEKIEDSSGAVTSFERSPLYVHPDVGDEGLTSLPGYIERGDVFSLEPTRARVIEGPGLASALQRRGVLPAAGAAALYGGSTLLPDQQQPQAGIAGPLAKTADLAALKIAQKADAAGLPMAKVYDATGWAKGADGKWRWEFDDSSAKFNVLPATGKETGIGRGYGDFDYGGTFGPKDALIEHPNLSAAYDASEITPKTFIRDSQTLLGTDGGMFNPADKSITLYAPVGAKEGKSITLHEIQHSIQQREGFAKGGDPATMGYDDAETARLAQQLKASQDRYSLAKETGADPYGVENSVDAVKAELDRARNEWTAHRKVMTATRAGGPEEAYRRLAGEVEARNVQSRIGMTPDERRMRPFWQTEDVPRGQQIVQGQSGPSLYADMQALKRAANARSRTHVPMAPMTPGAEAARAMAIEAMNPASWPLLWGSRELGDPQARNYSDPYYSYSGISR